MSPEDYQLSDDENPADEQIRGILTSMKTIAVVGLSRHHEQDSYKVASYLQERGYWIIPVNPNAQEILGEKCFRSLKEIPVKIDAVLVFRPSEFAGAIVDEAIEIGAKVVWMQEGISDAVAAGRARARGLEVVMDKCMMKEHKRMEIDTSI